MTLTSEYYLGIEIFGLMSLSEVWFLLSQSYLNCADLYGFLSGMYI